eukprot:3289839-Pyramimonas_sp.AAC.1
MGKYCTTLGTRNGMSLECGDPQSSTVFELPDLSAIPPEPIVVSQQSEMCNAHCRQKTQEEVGEARHSLEREQQQDDDDTQLATAYPGLGARSLDLSTTPLL